jgi:hypothetical protein
MTKSLFQNDENGFPKDRRLREDGFIILAQATIRTDGFFVRAGFANNCALRAPTPSKFYGYTPSVKFERGFLGKPGAWSKRSRCFGNPYQNVENGLPQDRRLREDGFIILA